MYVLATKDDHIVPWTSVLPSKRLIGENVTFVLGESGHIAGVINPPRDTVKYGYFTSDAECDDPEEWLAKARYSRASWWSHWADWLGAQNTSELVPARRPGHGSLTVLENAPGQYVMAS